MQLSFACPVCGEPNRVPLDASTAGISCPCGWSRVVVRAGGETREAGRSTSEATPALHPSSYILHPSECAACGCDDLWRQKDFPQKLGLAIVGLGIVGSTIAWSWYRPVWAIGILMLFALADLLLYVFMPDVLVCYRCGARHRHVAIDETHPGFELETAERYRQEKLRLEQRTADKQPIADP